MADYNVKVEVDVNDSELNSAEQKIKAMDGKKINVDIGEKQTFAEAKKRLEGMSQMSQKMNEETAKGNLETAKVYQKEFARIQNQDSFFQQKAYRDLKNGDSEYSKQLADLRQNIAYQKELSSAKLADQAITAKSKENQAYLNNLQKTYADETMASYKAQQSYIRDIGNTQNKILNLDATKDVAQIDLLNKKLASVRTEFAQEASKGYNQSFTESMKSNLNTMAKDMNYAIDTKKAGLNDRMVAQYAPYEANYNRGAYDVDLDNMKKRVGYTKDWAEQNPYLAKSYDQVTDAHQRMVDNWDKADMPQRMEMYDDFNKSIKDFDKSYASHARAISGSKNDLDLEISRQIGEQRAMQAIRENSRAKAHDKVEYAKLQEYASQYATAGTEADIRRLNNQVTLSTMSMANRGTGGLSFVDSIKQKAGNLAGYMVSNFGFETAIRGFKSMYDNVYQVDTAMTELKKVTDESDAVYNSFLRSASKEGKSVSATMSGMIESTAQFARLGYGLGDATQLAKVANTYANVGDEVGGVENASQSIVSTMKAFNIEAGDAGQIIDKFNTLGNKFAISSGGVGEALKRSASSMAAAGNTLDESAALVTAAI